MEEVQDTIGAAGNAAIGVVGEAAMPDSGSIAAAVGPVTRADSVLRPNRIVVQDTVVNVGPWAEQCDSVQPLIADLDSALAAPQLKMPVIEIEVKPEPELPEWTWGKAGELRQIGLGDDSGILALITAIIVLIMISYRSCRRLFRTLSQELWGMRKRNNAFDEHTSNETRVLGLMAVQWSVSVGILLYSFMQIVGAVGYYAGFGSVMKVIGLVATYYIVQICTYSVLGYTFATPAGRRYFLQGFVSSQVFLGLGLLVPSLVAIFYPEASILMVKIGAVLYILARIVFISKGFRIFYQNFLSLLYFILYLCTLEIIPVILVYKLALNLVGNDPV